MAPLTAALLGVQHPHSDTHLQTLLRLTEVERVLLWDAFVQVVQGQGAVPASGDDALQVAHCRCSLSIERERIACASWWLA